MVDRKEIYSKVAKTKDEISDLFTTQNTTLSGMDTKIDTINTNTSGLGTKIGATSDDYTDSTVFGVIDKANITAYTGSFIYPTGVTAVTLTDGSYVEVIPASTITSAFRIIGLFTAEMTTNGWYEFIIGQGAAASETAIASTADYARVDTYTKGFQMQWGKDLGGPYTSGYNVELRDYETRGGFKPITTPLIAANTRIAVELNGAGGGVDIKLLYQEY